MNRKANWAGRSPGDRCAPPPVVFRDRNTQFAEIIDTVRSLHDLRRTARRRRCRTIPSLDQTLFLFRQEPSVRKSKSKSNEIAECLRQLNPTRGRTAIQFEYWSNLDSGPKNVNAIRIPKNWNHCYLLLIPTNPKLTQGSEIWKHRDEVTLGTTSVYILRCKLFMAHALSSLRLRSVRARILSASLSAHVTRGHDVCTGVVVD